MTYLPVTHVLHHRLLLCFETDGYGTTVLWTQIHQNSAPPKFSKDVSLVLIMLSRINRKAKRD